MPPDASHLLPYPKVKQKKFQEKKRKKKGKKKEEGENLVMEDAM